MTRRFRKRPVVVEAFRFKHDPVPEWLTHLSGRVVEWKPGHIILRTLEGDMRADPGDWIVKGVQGEVYPVQHDIFMASYKEVRP